MLSVQVTCLIYETNFSFYIVANKIGFETLVKGVNLKFYSILQFEIQLTSSSFVSIDVERVSTSGVSN